MKSQENQSISQYFWLKKGFWFGFLFALSLELGCYLYIEKKNKQKRKPVQCADVCHHLRAEKEAIYSK